MRAVVTGSGGFVGRNLTVALTRHPDFECVPVSRDTSTQEIERALRHCDVLYHLAGVNRPTDEKQFEIGNVEYTRTIVNAVANVSPNARIVFASSTQVERSNPYGLSKKEAEEVIVEYSDAAGNASVVIYRLPNLFGKWSRPNYNSVVATFCHNLLHGIELRIDDPAAVVEFAYIDDVVEDFIAVARMGEAGRYRQIDPIHRISIGALADRLRLLHGAIQSHTVPDLSDGLTMKLLSTLLWFAGPADTVVPVGLRSDERGWLFELIRTENSGQVFISSTKPGVVRGNHYHDTKIEKFCLISGEARVEFRDVVTGDRTTITVSQRDRKVIHIPPGYTHSVTNTGSKEMIMAFWANEPFDPNRPDTYYEEV